MPADQTLRDGNLNKALAELQDEVRNNPSDAKKRVFLFQLLAVHGQWDRALTQLEVAGELDSGTLSMVQMYREALHCERLREEIFAGKRSPIIFGEPEGWVALAMEALRVTAEGRYAESQQLREQAFEAAPVTSGSMSCGTSESGDDGQAFEWIADADTRLGPILEAVVNGRYYWIPFHRIREIHVEEPEDLRDVVWMPVHFVWANGGETVGLIPSRYPGSENQEEDQIRLARRTEWAENAGGVYTGLGQRMLATDGGEYPLMDVRLVRLDTVAEAPTDGATQSESLNG